MKARMLESCIFGDGKNHHWPQALAVVAAALSTFSTGALIAWTSPSIPILTSNASHIDSITLEEASYFTIIPPIATVFFSPIFSLLVEGIGRRKCIMVMAFIYFLCWILIAFAQNLPTLYISRFIEGIGDAALFTAVPIYVGEVTEPVVRVSWGNLMAFCVFFGQFLVNVIGSYCDIRTTALILCTVPLVQFFLMAIMPESPYFLLIKNREEEARTSLKILRWKNNVEQEFKSLNKDVQRQIAESGTLKDLFFIPTNRKTLLIAIGIRATQQLSGLPAFFMYTQYMFNQAGSDISASISAIIFTGTFVVVITGFAFVIHKFGRKPLMTFSCLGCGFVLAIEAVYFYIHEKTDLDVSGLSWIPLAGMMMYVPACGSGLAIIPTLMLGELFSASVKGKAMGVLNIFFSLFVLTVVKLFQSLTSNFGMCVPFCLFSVCCCGSAVFSYYFVPETKGKTLEEIQQNLRGNTPDKMGMETTKF